MVPSAAARGGKTTKTAAITTCSIKVPRSHVDIVIDKLHPNLHTILFGGGSSSSSSNDGNNNSPINDECNDCNSRRACLVANANEALRILQAKRAHFGVKDKPLVRAALVIDYLCRNNATTNNDTTTSNECNYHRTAIPAATLAAIAGFTSSKKDKQILEVMQTVLAEHLDDSSIGLRLATKQQQQHQREVYRSTSKQHDDNDDSQNCSTGISRKRDASLLLSSDSSSRPKSKTTTTMTMNTTRTTSILKPTNLVQELCITLGPSIPDAEYALAYAIDIFHFLAYGGEKNSTTKNDNNNNNNTFTTYELRRDMERHTRYYEAACFYLAVKKSEGRNGSSYTFPTAAAASNKKKKKKATRKKKEEEAWKDNNVSSSGGVMQESQQLEEEDGDIDNENDERHLTELDVIRETNLLEGTFMTVLACIRDTIDGIVIPSSFDFTRKRGVDDKNKSGGSTLFDVAGEMKTRNRNSSSSNDIAITTTIVDNSLDNAFEQWKRVVLLEAKTAYKNMTMTNEVGRQQAAAADDNNCWLTHAADNVLRNYGFPL